MRYLEDGDDDSWLISQHATYPKKKHAPKKLVADGKDLLPDCRIYLDEDDEIRRIAVFPKNRQLPRG